MMTQVQDDGVRIRRLAAGRAELVGAVIERVEGRPMGEVLQRLATVISADNAMGVRAWIPYYLITHEVLAGLDLLDTERGLYLEVTRADGVMDTITLAARPLSEAEKLVSGAATGMAEAGQYAPPQVRDAQQAPYWFQWLPEYRVVYARIDRLVSQPDWPFPAYVDSLFSAVDRLEPARLILDLRALSGGNHISQPLIHSLIRREQFATRGRLFVLIGRHTFSAGQNLVTLLAQHVEPIFVGEPTGGRPNAYGVLGRFNLPRTGLEIRYSRHFIQDSDPADYRHWQEPHIPAGPDVLADIAGRDPALEAVFAADHQLQPFDTAVVSTAYEQRGLNAALVAIRGLQRESTPSVWQLESAVNQFGYALLRSGRTDDALAVFRLNTELFPGGWNAWDSYGEALAALGFVAEAVTAYERALTLNGYNANARRALRLLALPR
ncbi:MAG TPA: hypothetical protein VFZ24_12550 [Longimicrobiales bacterium]